MPSDIEGPLRPLWMRAQAGDEVAYRQALTLAATRLRGFFEGRLSGLPAARADSRFGCG